MEVICLQNMTKKYDFLAVQRVMDLYAGRTFYITLISFGKIDFNLHKHQKLVKLQMSQNR